MGKVQVLNNTAVPRELAQVEIQNARVVEDVSWTTAGFELLHAPSMTLSCNR